MRKFICLLLCLIMVCAVIGCSSEDAAGPKPMAETAEQQSKREAVEKNLTNFYGCPTEYMFEKYMEPMGLLEAMSLKNEMSELMNCFVKHIDSATLFIHNEFTIYTVAFVLEFNTGLKEVYSDSVITRDNGGKQMIVLQKTLSEETQKALVEKNKAAQPVAQQFLKDSMDSFCKESKALKEWYEKRKEVIKIKSTSISISEEIAVIEDVYTKDGRKLVWSEEFEGAKKLSDTKMRYYRTMNNASLLITNDDSNLSFKDGTMTMHARPASGAYHYSIPDGITTYGTMAYSGGYLEMRAKVPFEHGAWPSFWEKSYPGMYETNYMAEIDIFEVFSSENSLACCLHKWGEDHYSGGKGNNRTYYFESNEVATDWHTYGFEWTDTEYRFYIDGECYCVLFVDDANDFAPQLEDMSGFQDLHYVILNNFIFNEHSSWAPEGSALPSNSTKEITYTVDYIRLYQNDNDKLIVLN